MQSLSIAPSCWDDLHGYFDHPFERMAFLAAVPSVRGGDAPRAEWTVVDVMYLDDETDYEFQGWAGMELADDIRPRTLQWATRLGAALVEVHSHGVGRMPTTFSPTDLRGLAEVVPQFIWRLGGRPYGAVVVGGRRDHDSLAWVSRDLSPDPISRLAVGSVELKPTAVAVDRFAHLEELK